MSTSWSRNKQQEISDFRRRDDDFDFHQSSNRVCIERAFGVLIKRFPILWRPLCVRFDRITPLIAAMLRVHNFCIDHNVPEEHVSSREFHEVQPTRYMRSPYFDKVGRPLDYLSAKGEYFDAERKHRRKSSGKDTFTRSHLMQQLREHGYRRPKGSLIGLPRKKKGKGKGKKKK